MRRSVDAVTTAWAPALVPDAVAAYDALVEAHGHVAQTRRFAALAIAGRPRAARLVLVRAGARPIGAALVLRLGPLAWIERGPACALADLPRVLDAVEAAARRRGIARLMVCPAFTDGAATAASALLVGRGYRAETGFAGLHRVTAQLDLERSDADLLVGPARAKLRTEIRRAVTHGARAELADTAGAELLARLGGRSAAWGLAAGRLVETGGAAIAVVRDDGGPVAAALVASTGALATYVAGATVSAPRPYGKLVLALVRAMAWARAAGCTRFDLGGIPAPGDVDPKRLAIARFKMDFAPELVSLVGPHRRWLLWP